MNYSFIAIDGPSGSGKSTLARAPADKIGVDYLDTGAMYRAGAYVVLQSGKTHQILQRQPEFPKKVRFQ